MRDQGRLEQAGCEGVAVPPAVSAFEPDWSREAKRLWEWSPSRSLLGSLRAYQRAKESNTVSAALQRKVAVLRHRFWSVLTGADIPLGCEIGGGLLLPHPNGIVIHPQARIGPNCLIFQQVTLGAVGSHSGVPSLGGHVDVGAGAKILGGVELGAHARVGANAVVLCDVPPGATAIGIPARITAQETQRDPGGEYQMPLSLAPHSKHPLPATAAFNRSRY